MSHVHSKPCNDLDTCTDDDSSDVNEDESDDNSGEGQICKHIKCITNGVGDKVTHMIAWTANAFHVCKDLEITVDFIVDTIIYSGDYHYSGGNTTGDHTDY